MAMLNNQMVYIYIIHIESLSETGWLGHDGYSWLIFDAPRDILAFHEKIDSCTGWWFGTWILFFHILGIIIPTDFHIFQRGRYTTNQIMVLIHCGFPKIEKHKHVRPEARNHQVSSPTKNNTCLLTNWLMRNHQLNNQSWFQKSPEMITNPSTTNQTWTIKSNKGLLR